MSDLFHIYYLRILAFALILFAVWMVFKYEKTPGILAYAGFFLGFSAIAYLNTLLILPLSISSGLWLTRAGYFSGVFTFTCLALFSWFYPIPSNNIPKNYILFWLIPLVLFFPIIFFSPEFIKSVETTSRGFKENVGVAYLLFPAFVVFSYFFVLKNLFKKIRLTSGHEQWQVKCFLVVLSLTAGTGVVFDVLVPSFTHFQKNFWGVESSGLIALSSLFIVLRK